jgi:hypothetical protein
MLTLNIKSIIVGFVFFLLEIKTIFKLLYVYIIKKIYTPLFKLFFAVYYIFLLKSLCFSTSIGT